MEINPLAAINFTGLVPLHPPKAGLLFQADLANPGAQAVWFLLPDTLNGRLASENPGVDDMDLFLLGAGNPLLAVHFRGPDGFYAVRLLPSSQVTLNRLLLSVKLEEHQGKPGSLPPAASLETASASELLVEGRPVEQWLGEPAPGSPAVGEIEAYPLSNKAQVKAAHHLPGYTPLPVQLRGFQKNPVRVFLSTGQSTTQA